MLLALSAAVLVAPRAKASSTSPNVTRALVSALAVATAVMLLLSGLSLVADRRLRVGQKSDDLAALNAATTIAPWHAAAQYLATYRQGVDAVSALALRNPTAAESVSAASARIDNLIDADRHDYASLALKAYILTQLGSIEGTSTFEAARDAADAASRVYPLSPVSAYLKALAQVNLGDAAGALETLEPVWDVDPRYSEAGVLYAQLLAEQGRTARAADALAELKTRFPANPQVQSLSQALEASGTAK